MNTTDPRIDAYIANAAEFAKPILQHLRALVHKACPQVTETIKWSMPFFDYKGIMCNMAAYKQYCSFGFMKAKTMQNAETLLDANKKGMGHFDRITSLQDLPADNIIIAYLKEAMELNEQGVKMQRAKPTTDKKLQVPAEITEALKTNETAATVFEKFGYSHKKEYAEWITEAKTETTRNKRVATMLEWLAEGKSRYWKYQN